jgi:hypothetical protein
VDSAQFLGEPITLLSSVEAYDTSTGKWTEVAPLPAARYLHGAGLGSDGRIYVVGGSVGCPDDCADTPDVIAYDPASDSWSAPLAPIPTTRCCLSATGGDDGRIYAIGGYDTGAGDSRRLEIYTPSTNSWEAGPPMNLADRRGLLAAAGADGLIYAVGGYRCCDGPFDSVETFDPATGEWSTGPTLLYRRTNHAGAVGLDGRIYAIGGCTTLDNCVNHVLTATAEVLSTTPPPEIGVRLGVRASASRTKVAIRVRYGTVTSRCRDDSHRRLYLIGLARFGGHADSRYPVTADGRTASFTLTVPRPATTRRQRVRAELHCASSEEGEGPIEAQTAVRFKLEGRTARR